MADRATLYRWDSMEFDRPMDLIERRRIVGEQAMVSHVTLAKGFFVPTHRHSNEQIACVQSGCLRFGLGEVGSDDYRELDVKGGESLLLPANFPHSARALEDTVVLDVFSPPSEKTGVDE